MFTKLLRHFKLAFPIPIPLLAVAIAGGLAVGAFYLDQSADLATAVGIAVGIAAALGGWLGLRLYLATVRVFITWIDAIGKRIASLEARMATAERPNRDAHYRRPRRSLAMRIVLVSAYITPICWVVTAMGAIAAVLSTQLGPGFVTGALTITILAVGMLILAAGIQSLYLWRLQRQVASFERMLNRIDAVSPITLKAQVLNHDISRAECTVRRLTGAGKPVAEQATA